MTISSYMDKTPATRITPGGHAIDRASGKFNQAGETLSAIMVHVAKPKLDEALPGGAHITDGDLIVNCNSGIGLNETDVLEFYGARWRVVTELRRYDVLNAVLRHGRKAYLVRKVGESASVL